MGVMVVACGLHCVGLFGLHTRGVTPGFFVSSLWDWGRVTFVGVMVGRPVGSIASGLLR